MFDEIATEVSKMKLVNMVFVWNWLLFFPDKRFINYYQHKCYSTKKIGQDWNNLQSVGEIIDFFANKSAEPYVDDEHAWEKLRLPCNDWVDQVLTTGTVGFLFDVFKDTEVISFEYNFPIT